MSETQSILTSLADAGYRLTNARKAIVDFFVEVKHPASTEEILNYLANRAITPNKTTLYRELDFLLEKNIVQEFDFGEGKKRYELASHGHHHHLICTNCNAVEGVEIKEDNLEEQELDFLEKRGFRVTRHMLEFFGLCKKCQTKK